MKRFRKFLIIFTFLIALLALLPAAASARTDRVPLLDDQVIFGGFFRLEDGETLDGSIVNFGGVVELGLDSQVLGDLINFGGNVETDGEIGGSLISLGGRVLLGEHAVVEGDLIAPGAYLSRDSGSVVLGQVLTETGPVAIEIPDLPRITVPPSPPQGDGRPEFSINFSPLANIYWFLLRSFAISALAVLVVIFLPEHTRRVSEAVVAQPVVSGGIGFLTVPVVVFFSVLFVITIFLSPLGLLAFLILSIAVVFGWIAVGLEIGNRLAVTIDQEWSPALGSGIGTFVLSFVVGSIGFVPCLGAIAGLLVAAAGLGAVVLTRFGSQGYLGAEASVES
jgi:hypothetical protein